MDCWVCGLVGESIEGWAGSLVGELGAAEGAPRARRRMSMHMTCVKGLITHWSIPPGIACRTRGSGARRTERAREIGPQEP